MPRFSNAMYFGTEFSLKHLVHASMEAQSADPRQLPLICSERSLAEYHTVRFAGPRQIGHTTAIFEASKMFQKPLFVFYNLSMADNFRQRFSIGERQLRSFAQLSPEKMRGLDPDAVFVDCASMMSHEQEQGLKKVCLDYVPLNDYFCLVLVG